MKTNQNAIRPGDVREIAEEPVGMPVVAFRDEADDPAEEREREQAFDAVFQWKGRDLLPFSSSRKSLFLQQRLAMGAPDLGACLRDLDAFFGDALRILFLCGNPPEVWQPLRTDALRMQLAIDDWADANVGPGEAAEAVLVAFRIYAAANRNQHEAAPAGTPHRDDVGN
jgi:hypothetical protein